MFGNYFEETKFYKFSKICLFAVSQSLITYLINSLCLLSTSKYNPEIK